MTDPALTILFMPESAYGPTNQCIGIGRVLADRGHRVVFAAEASWRGRLTALGFEEDLVDLAPPAELDPMGGEQDAGAFWKEFIRDTAPEFRKPTIEQLSTFIAPTFQALIDGAVFCEPALRAIVQRVRPDVLVEDNVVAFPALMTAGAPFVRIVSCNPLEVKGPEIPPPFAGYPSADPRDWPAYRAEYDRVLSPIWERFNAFVVEQGAPPLPPGEFIHSSQFANLYVYPRAVDYTDRRPLDGTWTRLQSSVRSTDTTYQMPDLVRNRPPGSRLIYLSLGSLGSADVDLMRRLVDVLGRTPHTYIVSKGPQHDQYTLAENMVGAEFLPQVSIISEVDLVITHGGNNTTTEALHFGKPMIVLPLFWDQYDNAQRIHECDLGVRLSTYTFTDEEMFTALDRLLTDTDRQARLAAIAAEVQASRGTQLAADVIEGVGRTHRPRR